jgi:heme oxygenase
MMPNQKLVNSKKKVNDKTTHVFKNLSMSNEEKILKRNYGANYESTVANLSNSRLLQLGRT